MFDIYRQPLPNWKFRLFPTDTRSIIAAVFFGLGMTVALQITERIDTALTGGTMFLFAYIVVQQFETPGVFFYGLVGALLVAWINPIVANLTATSPLAPLFFTTNAAHTIPLLILVWAFKPKHRGFKFWEFAIILQIANLFDAVPHLWASFVVFQFPDTVSLGIYAAHQVAAFVGIVIAFPVMHRLMRSGLIESVEEPEQPMEMAGRPA